MTREEIPQFKTLEEEKAYWESKGSFGIEAQREEIREGIEKTICSSCDDVSDWEKGQTLSEAREYCRQKAICAYCTDLADALLVCEDKLGVVIKADYTVKYSTAIPAGTEFVAVESLIGDKDAK